MSDQPTIHQLMPQVMSAIGTIGKGDFNQQQNYAFRGIDSVMNAAHKALCDHGVFFTPEVLETTYDVYRTKNGAEMRVTNVRVAYTFYGPAGDSVRVVTQGEASDNADKATNKALSAALKYALLHTFCVPTKEDVENDADRTTVERESVISLVSSLRGLTVAEKATLKEAWSQRGYGFQPNAVPEHLAEECRTLIESHVGTEQPQQQDEEEDATTHSKPEVDNETESETGNDTGK